MTAGYNGRRLSPPLTRIDGSIPRTQGISLSLLGFAIVIAIWVIATTTHVVSPLYLPAIPDVISALITQAQTGDLWSDIGISVSRILVAFAIAAVMAIPTGLVAARVRLADALVTPLVEFSRYLPVAAFLPLTIIWAGTGEAQKYVVIWIGTFFALVLMIIDDIRRVPPEFIDFGRTLGMSESRILWKIVLRGAMPNIVDSLRIAFGWCWTWLILAELVAATSGIGYRITLGQRYLETNLIFAYILVLGVLGLLSDQLFRVLHRIAFRYLRKGGL
ncbi:nitrate transport permease nrtB (plasmid) [Frondihabitans sp. PAMC 28766]|uniref:ABC transporter permease n=1 Tax=Frondihabitans sp. PAMC 28766 TaxID=1795630 RepID=UPI00078D26BA|nr:ABC transporter permease [Frondihabitans sp. PAMC 28766]AMM22829.1 nitrate transport permease nrtB [Frondihabitans sp. PAMC 28766]